MKKRMIFVVLVCMGGMSLFGQQTMQTLWTTSKKGLDVFTGKRVISMNQAKAEILKFANQYKYYTDSYVQFDDENGWTYKMELSLNDNKGLVKAEQAPIYGEQMVGVEFIYGKGANILMFHNGAITDRMPTSNRRRLEQIIDQLISECR